MEKAHDIHAEEEKKKQRPRHQLHSKFPFNGGQSMLIELTNLFI